MCIVPAGHEGSAASPLEMGIRPFPFKHRKSGGTGRIDAVPPLFVGWLPLRGEGVL